MVENQNSVHIDLISEPAAKWFRPVCCRCYYADVVGGCDCVMVAYNSHLLADSHSAIGVPKEMVCSYGIWSDRKFNHFFKVFGRMLAWELRFARIGLPFVASWAVNKSELCSGLIGDY